MMSSVNKPVANKTVINKTLIEKVEAILDALAESDGVLGLSELARRSGVPKSTVHRLCGELVAWGVVERAGDAFRLGQRLFELGSRVPGTRSLRDAALPFLEELAVATGQTVHLAVLEGTDVMYVERLPGTATKEVPTRVAARFPLHCTATGRCLLAFGPPELLEAVVSDGLDARTKRTTTDPAEFHALIRRISEDGFAVEQGEVVVGLMSVGAPVFGLGGQVIGAISVTGETKALDQPSLIPLVKLAATGLSQRLGASSPSP